MVPETWGHSAASSPGSKVAGLQAAPGWAVKVLPGKIVQTPVLGQCIIRHTPQGTEVELEQEQDLVTETKLQGGHLAAKEGVQVHPRGCDIQNIESPVWLDSYQVQSGKTQALEHRQGPGELLGQRPAL